MEWFLPERGSGALLGISIDLPEGSGFRASTERGTGDEEESADGGGASLRPVVAVLDPFRLVGRIGAAGQREFPAQSFSKSPEPD
jgi:hypothetical protein